MGVVGHVEHRAERDAPGFSSGLAGLADEHRHAAVDGLGEFGVLARAEDRAGAGVGVQKRDVLGGEGEAALGVAQVFDGMGEEDELGALSWSGAGRGRR